jgi:hypothetical protein
MSDGTCIKWERNHDAEIRYLGCNRERRIFVARRLGELPIKLEELAEEFESCVNGRTRSGHAFDKVQNAVRHRVAAMERPMHWQRTETVSRLAIQPRLWDLNQELDSNNLFNSDGVAVDLSSVGQPYVGLANVIN